MRALEVLAVLALRVGLSVVHPQCISSNDSFPSPTSIDLNAFIGFNMKLFAEVLPEIGNFVFSPYTVWRSLLLVYFGAEGKTLRELEWAMPFFDKAEDLAIFKATTLIRLYLDDSIPVKDCVFNVFKENITLVDFDQPLLAAQRINSAVAEDTRGMVPEAVSAGRLRGKQAMSVSAAFFKGAWEQPFRPEYTAQEKFFPENDVYVTLDMMHHVGHFRKTHSKTLRASVLELPFLGESASMLVVLPDKMNINTDLKLVLSKLERSKKSVFFVSAKARTKVSVKMPKFTVESAVKESLKQALRHLNVSDIFSENADLSTYIDVDGKGGLKKENGIGGELGGVGREEEGKLIGERGKGEGGITKARVNAIVEKAMLVIDEGGLSPGLAGNPNPAGRVIRRTRLFECDRPFAFLIVGNKNKAILFMGVYRGPREDLIRGIDDYSQMKRETN
ncbi:leukocyte elastase inhibitor-like isoform X2 [Penaeus chinensis]|uniref:leukocyte elastase inhibitor-like isoform X2 n=1 Tax=Penaeus chinensis TaxID=139456 RepID=UPI001FB7D4D4|nr:leukocyte elastase inhibitor-like isoform X2 [Penaeus chinensis]